MIKEEKSNYLSNQHGEQLEVQVTSAVRHGARDACSHHTSLATQVFPVSPTQPVLTQRTAGPEIPVGGLELTMTGSSVVLSSYGKRGQRPTACARHKHCPR